MNVKSMLKLMSIITIIVIFASSVSAQPRPRRFRKHPWMLQSSSFIGLHVGNDFKHDQYFVGAHFWLPLGLFWKFVPSADYCFTDDDSKRWQFNGDLIFKTRPVAPLYFGGGLAVQYLTLDKGTNVGGNVMVGFEFGGIRKPVMYPYIQARWTFLDDREYFSLLGGINFMLH